jgi:hypothetical protein
MQEATLAPIAEPIRARLVGFYGEEIVAFAESRGVRVRVLAPGETFAAVSGELSRLAINVDAWPLPPAGLFVVAERTVYLRSTSAMTIAHEFAHAIDCALGDGVYRSSTDSRIRRAFARATAFVTPYAASACDEYFAECVRAYVGANDTPSLWPKATRERLWALDSHMAAIVANLFAEMREGAKVSA